MEIEKITEESLKYPSQRWDIVIILGVMTVTFFLIFPAFFICGYALRIIRSTLEETSEVPPFNEQIDTLFLNGLKVFLITILYALLPIFLTLIWIFTGFSGISPQSFQFEYISFDLISSIIGSYVFIISGLAILPIALLAISNMALYNGEISAALRFREIYEHAKGIKIKNYLIWYVITLIAVGVILFVGWLTMQISVGLLLVPLLFVPYLVMFVARSAALIFTYGGE
jgi:hypothetical protein